MKFHNFKKNLIKTTILAGLAGGVMTPAIAQEAEGEADARQETVVVTGSRIGMSNIVSTSPITEVGALDLSLSNTVNAEQFLNTLPQTVPGFDSSSNNPGLGEATVDLRGLGAQRTLVLVNGRRYVSSNQNPGVVDLNTIPAALVEKVDILTGGASAIYGSDAMAGVVNFIMKDDFEGIQADLGYEQSQEGDGTIWTAALTAGGNFDNDRGNAVMSFEYTSREPIFQGDRLQSEFTLVDNGTGFRESGSVNIPSGFVLDFGPNYTDALGITTPCSAEGTTEALDDDDNPLGYCTTDSFGWIFDPAGNGALPFINSGPNTNRYNYAPANYLQIPQERWSIYTSGTYEISPKVEAYAQGIYVSSQTEQLLAPTPVFGAVTINLDNPFLASNTEALSLLQALSTGDSDGDGVDDATVTMGRRFLETGGRLSDVRNDSFQIQGGFRGDLIEDWTYDVFASFGQASTAVSQTGNVNFPAYQAAVAEGRANLFVPNGLSQEVVDEISVLGIITGTTETSIISASTSGSLGDFKSPMAENPIGVALGVEYHDESLKTRGAGLGPDVRGFNQAPDTSGSYDVYEYFAEANVPLIEGMTGVEELVLTAAYRLSDYSTVGSVDSYATGLSYAPIDGLRIRGQIQRSVRAPNIGELFQPQINGFPGVSDPCSGGDFGDYDNLNATDQAAADTNCAANGVPAGAIGTPLQVNAQIEALLGGNPDLDEEVSDTFTLGLVYEPTFIENLAVTVDYFDIEIEDVITTVPSQQIFDSCYIDGVQSFCDQITRFPSGTVDIFNSSLLNAASLKTSGVDISVDYQWDTDRFGTFGIYSLITWLDESSLTPLPGDDPIDCVGYYGGTCGEPTPEWNFNTRFDWGMGPWGARLRWSRISSVEDDQFLDGGTPTLFVPGVDAYDQFDLTGFYTVNDNVSLTFGIENLLDEDYVVIGDDSAEQSNTYPATYDTLGRTFFGRVSFEF